MGITIHYNGHIERARLTEMLDAAQLYCAEQRWHALEIEERIIGHVERVVETRETKIEMYGIEGVEVESITKQFPIDDTQRGLLITVHPESEPVWLTRISSRENVTEMGFVDSWIKVTESGIVASRIFVTREHSLSVWRGVCQSAA